MNTTKTFTSFADLAAHVNAEQHKRDVAAAMRLVRSRPLANKRPGTGPRAAKAVA